MKTTTSVRSPQTEARQGPEPAGRTVKPVKWFASFGALCVGLQVYVFSRWLLSGNATPTGDGPDPIPGWMVGAARAHEVLGFALMFVCGYFLVVKPWRRDRKLGVYGVAFFATLTCYWLNLAANYFNHTYTINTAFVNFGSWYNFIPGWVSPRANHLSEGILFFVPMYTWALVVPGIGVVKLMTAVKRRNPQLGNVGLLSVATFVATVAAFALEGVLWVRLGLYVFAGTIPSVTLFSGHYYQYPLYQPLIAGFLFWVCLGAVFYYKNDRGETLVERGLERLRATSRQKAWLRFLALAALFNLLQIVYALTFGVISLLPGFRWAPDIVNNRSYLRSEICGPGTGYACPGADVPIPRRGGAHLDPEGKLIAPD